MGYICINSVPLIDLINENRARKGLPLYPLSDDDYAARRAAAGLAPYRTPRQDADDERHETALDAHGYDS